MNESETRADHIDPALRDAGWGVVEASRIQREYNIIPGTIMGQGRRGRALIADYLLVYKSTRLAVIEAKAWDRPLTEGLAQAKQYAEKLEVRFAYSTNGQSIYSIDMETGAESEIAAYPTPEELWDLTFASQNNWRDRFAAVPFEDKGGSHASRYYQDIAVQRVMEAIAANKQRILLTLATGTGKTFIAFQIAWKLFKSRWNLTREPNRQPRILFLADRNILADQAYNAFSAFPEDAMVRIAPDEIRKKGKVPTNGSVFFTIFQTFMSGGEVETDQLPYFGDYPKDFFDFIIVDECHRGGASDESNWRAILDYFEPAVKLGLTATPKRRDNVNTYAYFGEPVYTYSLKEGINDGFLTPFRVRQHQTTLDEYVYTSDDKVVQGTVDENKVYKEKEFNRKIVISEREAKRVRIFLEDAPPNQKAIIFCVDQDHAARVRDLINQLHPAKGGKYCARVTANDGSLGEQLLREFQDNEKTLPTILTTSRKLSTGVDARNVRHIVLLRTVSDMIEFKQIIGRGTRLFDGKDYFTIHDFTGAFKLFLDPEWDGTVLPPSEPGPSPMPPRQPGPKPPPPPEKIIIKLADGKERQIKHMSQTSFWDPAGRPISAEAYVGLLYGKLPNFYRTEEELRKIWSDPETRRRLLVNLTGAGFGMEQLQAIQTIIDAEKSDIFDVLTYISFEIPTITRIQRVDSARNNIHREESGEKRVFIDFALSKYIEAGVSELDPSRLADLLQLKYKGIDDAKHALGDIQAIRTLFIGFQRHLYESAPHSAKGVNPS